MLPNLEEAYEHPFSLCLCKIRENFDEFWKRLTNILLAFASAKFERISTLFAEAYELRFSLAS
jgi:hypothetical protein